MVRRAIPPWVWLLVFATLVAIPLGGIYITNFIADPFVKRPVTTYPEERDFLRLRNQELWGVLELARVPDAQLAEVEVCVTGDSRARWLTVARGKTLERVTTHVGHRTLNLGLAGASIEESAAMLEHYSHKLPHLKLVVFGLPFLRVAEPLRDRTPNLFRLENSLNYYLDRYVFARSLDVLERGPSKPKRPPKPKKPPAKGARHRNASLDRSVIAEWHGKFKKFDRAIATSHLDRVRKAMTSVSARVVFWSPPEEAGVYRPLFQNEKLARKYEWYVKQVSRLGRHYNQMTEATEHEIDFDDPVHVRDGRPLLEKILATEFPANARAP